MSEYKPDITSGRSFSAIWFIPIAAVVIGILLVLHAQLSQGPSITVDFKTAEGLEAGKTKIKILDVEVGVVDEIELKKDMSGVTLTIKLDQKAEDLLHRDTQFWVVKARVGAGNVSGLSTLLSGAYIKLAPGTGPLGKRHFTGLESPPLTPAGAPGVHLNLFSDQAGSIGAGDAILYNGYKVGRVEGMHFDEDKAQVRYDIFIDAPFDQLVTSTSRFWNVSGISLKASADGVEIQTGSIDTVLFGGVAFIVPEGEDPGVKVKNDTDFQLFNSHSDMLNKPFKHKLYYVVSFSTSLRGLVPGAPVEYRGIPIGQVERIMFREVIKDKISAKGEAIPVLISIAPGRVKLGDNKEALETFDKIISQGVQQGLRGSLQTGTLLTGSLYIGFDYYDDVEPESLGQFHQFSSIPTIPTGFDRIEHKVTDLLDKLNALPLEDTLNDVNNVLVSVDRLVSDPNTRTLTKELGATLAELRHTLAGISPELNSNLSSLNKTLSNLETLSNTLADQPNALLLPTEPHSDPIPRAK